MAITKSICLVEPDKEYARLLEHLLMNCTRGKYRIEAIYNDIPKIHGCRRVRPDIILTEVAFHDKSPQSVVATIRQTFPYSKVIVLSSLADKEQIVRIIRAGADGYIIKTLNCHAIMDTLYQCYIDGVPLSPIASKAIVESFRPNQGTILTKRESQIMQLVSDCKSYSEISGELSIQRETTRKHIRNIYKKLKVHRKSDAIYIAKQERFIVA